uniref:Pectinesterase n=1 Tax=Solanum tuberosum TaxID=4113 RepID=M1DRW2_SOLTU
MALFVAATIVVCVQSQLITETPYNAVVSKDEIGNFNTIAGPILAAPDHSVKPFFIKIKKGTYQEYIRVDKKKTNIVLIGDGMDITIITGNRSFIDENKTYDTATVARVPLDTQYNTITAQHKEDEDSTSGIVLQNCTIKVAQDLSSVATYFGRPWGKFSRTVIMESYIDKLVDPRGWIEWIESANKSIAPRRPYYLEFKNRGPDVVTKGRVTWASVTTRGVHGLNKNRSKPKNQTKPIK